MSILQQVYFIYKGSLLNNMIYHFTGDKPNSTAVPTAYRPGRLSSLEILERLYPAQRRAVLELVLQGCNGDVVKAIEHFLSAQDTVRCA